MFGAHHGAVFVSPKGAVSVEDSVCAKSVFVSSPRGIYTLPFASAGLPSLVVHPYQRIYFEKPGARESVARIGWLPKRKTASELGASQSQVKSSACTSVN